METLNPFFMSHWIPPISKLVAFCTAIKQPSIILEDKNRDREWDSKKIDKNCDGNFEEEELL